MKAFIIRDKEGQLYMSLKIFSKKNGDWNGTGFIKLNDDEVENSEMIKFTDEAPTEVDVMFGNPEDYVKVVRGKISTEEIEEIYEQADEDNSFLGKLGGWFQKTFSMND